MKFTEFQSVVFKQVNKEYNVDYYARCKTFKPRMMTDYAATAWLSFMTGVKELQAAQTNAVMWISDYIETVYDDAELKQIVK
jgi:adenosylcobinamide amidohydrolase